MRSPKESEPLRGHVPALDGVRGLAVLTVFLYHYGGGARYPNPAVHLAGSLLRAGWCGVTLFFVLSGFLISGILWDGKDAIGWWRRFYWRRTLRIFPLYYATLFAVLVAAIAFGDGRAAVRHLWVYALYLQNVPPLSITSLYVGSPLLLVHFWSLAVEEQFYLLWPFLLVRVHTLRQARWLAFGVFLLSAGFRVATWVWLPGHPTFYGTLPARAGELAVGAWLAMSVRDAGLRGRVRTWSGWVFGLGMAGFLACASVARSFAVDTGPMYLAGLPGIAIAFGGLVALALNGGWVARIFCARWLRWLGGISYGVYVLHVLLKYVFEKIVGVIAPGAGRTEAEALTFVVAAISTLGLAQLSFLYFEQPVLRLRDRAGKGNERSIDNVIQDR